ncbi:MAG: hypothetical protein WAW45_05790 [Atribacterota bacterium]
MKQLYLLRITKLIWGLFLYSLGSVIIINAHIGYAPWDVFHVGAAKTMGVSIGTVAIVTGIFIGFLIFFLGEKIGLGTILNMVLIGGFIDIIFSINIIPLARTVLWSILMLMIALIMLALGTYFYISAGLGAGPRDSLMVALTRKTGLPIGVCRGMIEVTVVTIGWKLGGMVGIGTIITAFTIGFWIQIIFKLFQFDATKIEHETFSQTYKGIFAVDK